MPDRDKTRPTVTDRSATSQVDALTTGPLTYSALSPSRDGGKVFAVGTQARAELTRYDPRSGTFEPFLGGISSAFVSHQSGF